MYKSDDTASLQLPIVRLRPISQSPRDRLITVSLYRFLGRHLRFLPVAGNYFIACFS